VVEVQPIPALTGAAQSGIERPRNPGTAAVHAWLRKRGEVREDEAMFVRMHGLGHGLR
jgi:hypothetical protein